MKFVIPVDLSNESSEVLLHTAKNMKNSGCEIVLFHTVEPSAIGSASMINLSDIIMEELEKSLSNLKQEIESVLSSTETVKTIIKNGVFEYMLVNVTENEHPDLILFLSKNRKSPEKLLSRKHALQILGKIHQPFIILPPKQQLWPVRNIGLAIDAREEPSKVTMDSLKKISTFFGAELKPFHIDTLGGVTPDYYRNESTAVETDAEFEPNVLMGISNWCDNQNIDLLTIVTQPKNFLEKLFKLSITKELIQKGERPILVMTQ